MIDKPKTILIVEDEQPLLDVLSNKFSICGFNVLKAKDGQEGLNLALKCHPNIVLLDIIMPKMDGMTMLSRLRQGIWGRSVPVIILTNLTDNEKIAESMKWGAYDYLVKTDWTLKDLVKKVKDKLGMMSMLRLHVYY